MFRHTTIVVVAMALTVALPLAGQFKGKGKGKFGGADPDRLVQGGGQFPAGWDARPDRGAPSQIVFSGQGQGFHAMMGPAGTFFNSGWTKSGDYSFSARLTQTLAPSHPISYGLMFGGSDINEDNQTYSYFLVRNQGEYFIANREGANRPVVVNWTKHDAIQPQQANGRQTNTLRVQIQGNDVIFSVNDTEVHRLPTSQVHTDGLIGFRIGHNLDVDIDQISR